MNPESQDAWRWSVPEHFNIGVACTDAHLGTSFAFRFISRLIVGSVPLES
jgi:hypothetical protein